MNEFDATESEPHDDAHAAGSLPPRRAERLLADLGSTILGEERPQKILTTTLGRAQAAVSMARQFPNAAVVCSLLDLFHADTVRGTLGEGPNGSPPANLELRCEADFSIDEPELCVIPCSSQGDGELARDQLQAAYLALRCGGLLLTTTDNPHDTWLGEVVAALGGKVRRHAAHDGAGYVVRKAETPPKRIRDYRAEFAFRDGERLLHVASRPGVFSHRRVDPGARRLLEAMAAWPTAPSLPRVLDIGCGWGTVGIAAAARGAAVEAIDSHTRAVACSQQNAARNELTATFCARLEAYGRTTTPGEFDLAFANPPYYAQFQIAERFVAAAQTSLRPGGKLFVVTKQPAWYLERLPGSFADVAAVETKGYAVVTARRR